MKIPTREIKKLITEAKAAVLHHDAEYVLEYKDGYYKADPRRDGDYPISPAHAEELRQKQGVVFHAMGCSHNERPPVLFLIGDGNLGGLRLQRRMTVTEWENHVNSPEECRKREIRHNMWIGKKIDEEEKTNVQRHREFSS